MAEQTITSTTDPATTAAENTGGDPTQAVSPAKGENAASTSTTEGTEKTYTQADIDASFNAGVKKANTDWNKSKEYKEYKAWQDSQKTAEQLAAEKVTAAEKEKADTERKAAQLEAKVAALTKGIKADAVDDVISLALAKVSDDTDINAALDIIIKKYPAFASAEPAKVTTGVSFGAGDHKDVDGVTAAFMARNPELKI